MNGRVMEGNRESMKGGENLKIFQADKKAF
jgi:hypothetical protein